MSASGGAIAAGLVASLCLLPFIIFGGPQAGAVALIIILSAMGIGAAIGFMLGAFMAEGKIRENIQKTSSQQQSNTNKNKKPSQSVLTVNQSIKSAPTQPEINNNLNSPKPSSGKTTANTANTKKTR